MEYELVIESLDISTMKSEKKPKVSVCVVTYNHEKYIEQCLQSLVDQVTDFKFEIIVGDDCSVDGTTVIVEKFAQNYPDLVVAIFNHKNLGGTKNYINIHSIARGMYIAHMDGDDYALQGKLQALSDFLDETPECNVVYHRMGILDGRTGLLVPDLIDVNLFPKGGFSRSDILSIGSVGCHSAKMYRAIARPAIHTEGDLLDFFILVENMQVGKLFYIDKILGVYRANIGISQNEEKIRQLFLEHLVFFGKKYRIEKKFIASLVFRLFFNDLKSLKLRALNSFVALVKVFSPSCVFYVIKNRKLRRVFATPMAEK